MYRTSEAIDEARLLGVELGDIPAGVPPIMVLPPPENDDPVPPPPPPPPPPSPGH